MAKYDFSPHGCKCGLMREEDCTCKENIDQQSSDTQITAAEARKIASTSEYYRIMPEIWAEIIKNAHAGHFNMVIHPSILEGSPEYVKLTPFQERVVVTLQEAGFTVTNHKYDSPEYGEIKNAFKVYWGYDYGIFSTDSI